MDLQLLYPGHGDPIFRLELGILLVHIMKWELLLIEEQ